MLRNFSLSGDARLRWIKLVGDSIGERATVRLPFAAQIKTIGQQRKTSEQLVARKVQLDKVRHEGPLVATSRASNGRAQISYID